MKRKLKIFLFCISCLSLISWDRATKDLAKEHLADIQFISYLHDTFRLEYVENTGAALNLGDHWPKTFSFWLLSVLPLTFLLVLTGYVIKQSGTFPFRKMFVFALIIAGGLGNVIDRLIFDRHVSDFMNIGFQNIRTGIFNFADVWVTAGAVCLLLVYRQKELPPLPITKPD